MARLYCSEPRKSLLGLHSCDAIALLLDDFRRKFLTGDQEFGFARAHRRRADTAEDNAGNLKQLIARVSRTATPAHGLSTTELLEKRMYSMPDFAGSGGITTCVMISSSAKLVV